MVVGTAMEKKSFDLKWCSGRSLLYKSLAFITSVLCDYFPGIAHSLIRNNIFFLITSRNKFLQYVTQYPACWSAEDYAKDKKKLL